MNTKIETTNTYTYFSICSNGDIVDGVGHVAFDGGVFDPEYIGKLLDIEPFSKWKKGDLRKNGTLYTFSNFDCEKSDIEIYDVAVQASDTIKRLKNKIDILNSIKKNYDVIFCLQVVAFIYDKEQPVISFGSDIIEFCYLTGTRIDTDMYIN